MPDLSTAVDIGRSEEHGKTAQDSPFGIWLCGFDACGETARALPSYYQLTECSLPQAPQWVISRAW